MGVARALVIQLAMRAAQRVSLSARSVELGPALAFGALAVGSALRAQLPVRFGPRSQVSPRHPQSMTLQRSQCQRAL
jgi:hypothetical protein